MVFFIINDISGDLMVFFIINDISGDLMVFFIINDPLSRPANKIQSPWTGF